MELSRRHALRLAATAAAGVPLALLADRVAAADTSTLGPSQQLTVWERRVSPDGRYFLVLQGDGNVVVYGPGNTAIWSTGTQCTPSRLVMQSDGNLVLYDTAGRARWSSSTAPHAEVRTVMQSDGNLVVYSNNDPLWGSKVGHLSYPANHPLSLHDVGPARQMVVVVGASPSSTDATLSTWQIGSNGRWGQPYSPVAARTGYGGWKTSAARVVGDGCTPSGTYTLTNAFGLAANPGAKLPYTQVGSNAYRAGDPRDPKTYNVHQPDAVPGRTYSVSAQTAERYADYPTQYQHLVNIDVYTAPQSTISYDGTHHEYVTSSPPAIGHGFALYLHMNGTGDTAGCVSVPSANLTQIVQWLDPASQPRITLAPSAWLASS